MRPDFLFVYEHKARELDNLCLIKAELENRGYDVSITHCNNYPRYKYRYLEKPKVILHFCLRRSDDLDYIYAIVGRFNKLVNMQWEQVLSIDERDIAFSIPKDKAKLATHICWGEEAYERLKKNGVKNAVPTGAVQLDFLKGRLREYYYSKETLIEKYALPSNRIFLYISSYSGAALPEREAAEIVRLETSTTFQSIKKKEQERELVLEWLIEIMNKYQDSCVIYRPHPSENLDDKILKIAQRHERFLIIPEESVKQWILASDYVFTTCSTAIAEVFYANKPCSIMKPLLGEGPPEMSIYLKARVCGRIEDVMYEIEHPDLGFPIADNVIAYHYGENSDEYAYKKVADLLETVLTTSIYNFHFKPSKLAYQRRCKDLIKRLIVRFRITETTWPFCKIPKIRNWLEFFGYYWNKQLKEDVVSMSDIEERTIRLRRLIGDCN